MSLAARRNVFLIGVEALHNAARHSHAGRVIVDLQRRGRRWQLTVNDDGIGIDAREADKSSGFGLETMHHRAAEIGAAFEVEQFTGKGTTVRLVFEPRAEDRRLVPHMNIRATWKRIRGMNLRQ
jgi:signal transduction histidine kinase